MILYWYSRLSIATFTELRFEYITQTTFRSMGLQCCLFMEGGGFTLILVYIIHLRLSCFKYLKPLSLLLLMSRLTFKVQHRQFLVAYNKKVSFTQSNTMARASGSRLSSVPQLYLWSTVAFRRTRTRRLSMTAFAPSVFSCSTLPSSTLTPRGSLSEVLHAIYINLQAISS